MCPCLQKPVAAMRQTGARSEGAKVQREQARRRIVLEPTRTPAIARPLQPPRCQPGRVIRKWLSRTVAPFKGSYLKLPCPTLKASAVWTVWAAPSRFPRARSVRRHRLIHSAWQQQQQQQPARQPASKASQPAPLSGYVMPHENANGERKRVQPGSVNIATGDVNAASSSLVLRVCHRPQRGWRHHGCPTQTCGA